MLHTDKLAAGAAGALTCLALVAYAPAANAADSAFNDVTSGLSQADAGAARNGGVDGFINERRNPAIPSSTGMDTSDVVLGSLAGIAVVGAGAAGLIVVRRRNAHIAHPA